MVINNGLQGARTRTSSHFFFRLFISYRVNIFFLNDIRWYIEERTLSPKEERCRSGVDPGQRKIKGKKQPLKDHLYTCAHTHKNTSIKLSDSHVFSSYRLYISFFYRVSCFEQKN